MFHKSAGTENAYHSTHGIEAGVLLQFTKNQQSLLIPRIWEIKKRNTEVILSVRKLLFSFLKLSQLTFLFLFVSLMLTNSAQAGAWKERRDLKKMCKESYKECQKENSKKECYDEKRQCRIDNGVNFGADLKFLFGQAKDIITRALGKVDIKRGEDPTYGYYTQISVEAAYLKFAPGFTINHPNFQSYVTLPETTETKYLHFYVYDSDLQLDNYVTQLQTSPGRSFPRFFDGRVFESLTGVEYVTQSGKGYQFYFDSTHDIFGSFLPSKLVGEAIKGVNFVKNYFPYISALVPDVNSVPFNLKYQGVKIGRASLLSQKSFQYSSGVVVLFDHNVIRSL
jgi:hypothetical protein